MKEKEKQALAEQNKHIDTDEIKQDIFDTEIEIATMEREIKGYDLLNDRLSCVRASSRRSGVKERKEFIKKLKTILEVRELKCQKSPEDLQADFEDNELNRELDK